MSRVPTMTSCPSQILGRHCLAAFAHYRVPCSPRRACSRKIAAQFIALPNVFSKVEVLEHEVARNDPDLICVKMHMAYTAPIMGTKTIKNLLSLALDTTGPVRTVQHVIAERTQEANRYSPGRRL